VESILRPATLASSRATAVDRARRHAPEVTVYCAVRLVGLVVLAAMAKHPGQVTSLLAKWDGSWYLGVARHGYDTALTHRPDGALVNTNIVFFPLYPLLIAVVGAAVGLVHGALLVSLAAGILAAVAMRSIGELLYDKRTGVILAALWGGVLPTAVVESMAYTESLYTALAALTVLFLLKERRLAAGLAAFFAGLTHPTGAAATLTVGACLIAALLRPAGPTPTCDRTRTRTRGRGRAPWTAWAATIIAPLGILGYLVWVGIALGRWDGFTYMEENGWGSRPSIIGVWHQITTTATHALPLGYRVPVAVLALSLICAILLTMSLTRAALRRRGLPVLAFAWFSLALALFIGPTYFHAEARFLLPDFPLLLPPAVFLARRSLYLSVPVIAVCTLASAWYGGYLLTIWTHSP
jgi:hypothetical protein